jgi:hypothetical protein
MNSEKEYIIPKVRAITAFGGADGNFFRAFRKSTFIFENRRFQMKKFFAIAFLLICFTVSFASDGFVHNPNNDTFVGKGKKGDPPLGCTCLFHEIEEFVKGLFS